LIDRCPNKPRGKDSIVGRVLCRLGLHDWGEVPVSWTQKYVWCRRPACDVSGYVGVDE